MASSSSMTEAIRLTRKGKLTEATKLLRSVLEGGGPVASSLGPKPDGDLIDIAPERVSFGKRGSIQDAAFEVKATHIPFSIGGADRRFEERSYRGSARAMNYRLYRPAEVVDGMPLLVMLHGCTQSPEDFARGTRMNDLADEFGFLVVYPRQTQAANLQRCWNWFKPGDQRRDHGEPALLAGITRQVMSDYRVHPDRVYVAGLSAGGAAAAIMAAEYPDIYAAVGVHSGLACGAARDLPSALMAMKRGGGTVGSTPASRRFVPVITFHGDRDTTVHEVNSREIIAAASATVGLPLNVRIEEGRSASGLAYRREVSVDPEGTVLIEQWTIRGSGHAWSGGDPSGSYTDSSGPDASREMVRFFLERKRP